MAQTIVDILNQLEKYDIDAITKPQLGTVSRTDFKEEYIDMLKNFNIIKKYADKVDNATNTTANNMCLQIKNSVSALVNMSDDTFVNRAKDNIAIIKANYQSIKNEVFYKYVSAAIVDLGYLSNTNLKDEFQEISKNLAEQTEATLKKIEEQKKLIIEEATEKAEAIVNSARQTAQKISVQEAQEQFNDAANYHLKQARIWGGLIVVLSIVFFCFIYYLFGTTLPETWSWQILYYSALRICVITFLSTLLAFSFKILKSHLHLLQHNLHRKRISNSMSAFVESANSNEQRDIILSQLVGSVSTFGSTGLFTIDDDKGTNISFDSITKTIESVNK